MIIFLKKLLCLMVCAICTTSLFASPKRLGADHAEPGVASFLSGLNLVSGEHYFCSERDAYNLIALAEREKINVFELIDTMYRFAAPRNIRFTIQGEHIRKTQGKYDLGGERILAILAIDTLRYIEFGAILLKDQRAMDAYLEGPRETYIEIGTAHYESQFGFETLSPLLFDNAYGITVQKLFFKAPLEKLELFSPGKGAIHVKNMFRPKRWNLDVVTLK